MDRKFTKKKRNVAIVVDNCRAHPNINTCLQSMKLVFLPPNTTSITQPMDQGIIACMKKICRRLFVKKGLLKAMDDGKEASWNVLDAIYGIVKHGMSSALPPSAIALQVQ